VLPGNDVPVPTPIPPPSYVLKPDAPEDGLVIAEQVEPKPAIPIVPLVVGLSPGDASSVAPMGIPVGETDIPGDMPSGEVAAIPGVEMPAPPTCATAGVQAKSAACMATINIRRILVSICLTPRSAKPIARPDQHCRSRRSALAQSGRLCCWIAAAPITVTALDKRTDCRHH
jgi:hypothetical protein